MTLESITTLGDDPAVILPAVPPDTTGRHAGEYDELSRRHGRGAIREGAGIE